MRSSVVAARGRASFRHAAWIVLPLVAGALPLPAAATAVGLPLDPIVITASRTAEGVADSLASVSVIEREEIERRQATSLPDLLQGLPGVVLRSNGGLGHNTNLYLRGTNPDHVLLLFDGFALGSASSGFLPWQSLPLGQIDRVEVVRGPRSSLYGSSAIGGVVQLFGGRGGGPLAPQFDLGIGSDALVDYRVGVAGDLPDRDGDAWIDANLGFRRTDGFDVSRGDQPDRDGYRGVSGSLRAGWDLSDRLTLDATLLRAENRLEFDGSRFAGNEKDSVIQVVGVTATARPTADWTATVRAGRTWDLSTIYFEGDRINRFDTRRDQFSWQNDIALSPDRTLTLGVDAVRDSLDASDDYAVTERDNLGVFGQFLGDVGGHALQLALRHDDNEQFGGETTGSIGWGYEIADGLRLTAGYGTAFKAPTFNDLYGPAIPFFSNGGDPDLQPESSRSFEVGLAGRHGRGGWSLNAFQTDIDNLIAYEGFPLTPGNIQEARIRGVEFSADARFDDWRFDADLTLLDPRNQSAGANNGKLLQRRPEQTLRVDVGRRIGQLEVGTTLFVSGRRFDNAANTERLAGYGLVDLRAAYPLSPTLELQGRIANLFDRDYETAAGFAQPGRTFVVTLRYRP
jgi:vitamin B12 transporter